MKRKQILIGSAILLVAFAIAGYLSAIFILENPLLPPRPPRPDASLAVFIMLKTVISFVNLGLLLVLVFIYGSLYRSYRSRFTLGLLVLISVLLLYALTSNPLLHYLFGYSGTMLGPFTIIPDIFATIALIILLYLSQE